MTTMMVTRQQEIARGIREIRQSSAARMRASELHVDQPRRSVDRTMDLYSNTFPPAPRRGGNFTPGAARVAEVALVAPDERVFGRTLGGLGNGCTSSGAAITASVIGAGTGVAAGYMSGTLGNQIQTTAQNSNVNALLSGSTTSPAQAGTAGFGDLTPEQQAKLTGQTTTTTSSSSALTSQQRWGAAFSILGTAVTSSWNAVCQARQNTSLIGDSAQIGRDTTDATVALIQSSRSGTGTTNAAAATTTTTTTTTEQQQVPSTREDDKKMLYIGGGIAVVAIAALLLMK